MNLLTKNPLQATFEQPFDLSFVPINGSIGPSSKGALGNGPRSSGAFSGGDGQDQFYILDANLSKSASLPSWTDENLFYLPFTTLEKNDDIADGDQLQSETVTLGAELECQMVNITDLRFGGVGPGKIVLKKTVKMGEIEAECSSTDETHIKTGTENTLIGDIGSICQVGTSALELVLRLNALNSNATQDEKNVCGGTVIFGWARRPEGTCKSYDLADLTDQNLRFVQCQPRLMRGKYFHSIS